MRFGVTCIAIIITLLIAYFGATAYIAQRAMVIPRLPLEGTPADVGLEYEDVSFLSEGDNTELKGWFIPAGNSSGIVIVNGGYQNRLDATIPTLQLTKDLIDNGYSVLLFDLRGRGESEGRGLTLTNNDWDIRGAVNYLKSRELNRIYILGFSSGAASSVLSGAEVDGMVLDSCFASVREMFIRGMIKEGYPKLIAEISSPGVFLIARVVYGYQAQNPEDRIGDVACPILLIHGEEDTGIPVGDAHKLHDASSNPLNGLWVVPGSDHCQAYNTEPISYMERVTSFPTRR